MDAAFREELRRAWAERVRRAKKEEGERRRRAITRAEAAARFLKEKYGVEKVTCLDHLSGAGGLRPAPIST